MAQKNHTKYRVDSIRLQEYDYSCNVAYFVTIFTKNHKYFFGNIVNEKIQLSKIGMIAKQYWLEISKHSSRITLDEFIIMPNHVHGILFISDCNTNTVETPKLGVSTNQKSKTGEKVI